MFRSSAIVLYVCAQCVSISATAQVQKKIPSITVNSSSTVTAKPDKVVITAGIETSNNDITVAKTENAAIFERAMAAIEFSGVQKENVRTTQLLVAPRWDSVFGPSREQRFLGYFVTNTIVVTLTDISKLEELTTNMLVAGVNYVHDVNFESSQLDSYRDSAREQALRAAFDKAQKMAAVLDAKVGRVISISEGHYDDWSWSRGVFAGGGGGGVGGGGPSDANKNYALGDLTIGVNVVVEFELKR